MASREVKKKGFRWRLWLSAAGWCVVFASTAVAAHKVQHYVRTDPQFVLSPDDRAAVTVQGAVYVSPARIARVFESDYGRSVFSVNLAERRRRLLGIDWVREASISRIWPNRLVVRISERRPVAFVDLPLRFGPGSRVLLIDGEGMLLDPPPQARFSFPILSGISEEQPEAERHRRVRAMQDLLAELGPLARNVSEINATTPDDLRVITQLDGRGVELALGDTNYARRMQNFLNHYQEIRKRLANATSFDLRLDDRITAKE